MAGFFALNSKAIWAVGLGLAAAVGAGTFVKTEKGQPLAVALVEKIRGATNEVGELPDKNEFKDKTADSKITKNTDVKPELKQRELKQPDTAKLPEKKAEKKPEVKSEKSIDKVEKTTESAKTELLKKPEQASKLKIENKKAEVKKQVIVATPPSIDLLRVARDGYVVMAGRAKPNTTVLAYNGGKKIGETKSSANGDYVFVFDEPLDVGEHELIVKSGIENKTSLTSGVIILPENKDNMIVLLSKPGEASKILQMPSTRFGPKIAKLDDEKQSSDGVKISPELPIAINAVDVEEKRYYVAGAAKPQSTVNVYIDNKYKGQAITGEEGAFLYYGRESISIGQHALRVDMLGDDNATVIARAEVVLDHETQEMKAAKKIAEAKMQAEAKKVEANAKLEVKKPTDPLENAAISSGSTGKKIADIGDAPAKKIVKEGMANSKAEITKVEDPNANSDKKNMTDTVDSKVIAAKKLAAKKLAGKKLAANNLKDGKKVIKSGSSVIIRRGDSLWKVSRRKLGAGRKYTIIYSANLDQVKNPHRIYPGQVLKIPKQEETSQ